MKTSEPSAAKHYRFARFLSILTITSLLPAAACKADPETASGRMGSVQVSIPKGIIATNIVYSGEDTWKPETRGTRTADQQIESFSVALDRRTLKLVNFDDQGHTNADRLDTDANILVDIDRVRVPATDAGIEARHREFVTQIMHRSLSEEAEGPLDLRAIGKTGVENINGGFNANYFSQTPTVNISCDRSVQVVSPFADLSNCLEDFAVPTLSSGARAFIKKTDLPRWREIRDAVLDQIPPKIRMRK